MFPVYTTLYTLYLMLFSIQWTDSVNCTLYSVQFTLYSAEWMSKLIDCSQRILVKKHRFRMLSRWIFPGPTTLPSRACDSQQRHTWPILSHAHYTPAIPGLKIARRPQIGNARLLSRALACRGVRIRVTCPLSVLPEITCDRLVVIVSYYARMISRKVCQTWLSSSPIQINLSTPSRVEMNTPSASRHSPSIYYDI